ncbi:HlyD family secretion protein [Brumicola blandensis]|uniref:Efflux RND transporter periplasmic adaptor subunit n=1 Tax=Brumicola blandensis TaxID=3075611 RepID=A0AAW8QWQ1_9ALTE|nr:efflux RND transporter periplasmic adaptor subunit [Alteromonas sp. W409]MDT0581214.1 efflux RND transporter periplasmic adaptor subunit [Alteromonas sp. W409]
MMLKQRAILPIALVFSLALFGCGEEIIETAQDSGDKNIKAPAELVSMQEVTIGPPNVRRMWNFKIEYLARENAIVKPGDVLVKFDGQRLRNDLVGRQSELEAAIKEAEQRKLNNEATLKDLLLDLAEAKMNEDKARRKVEITDASRSEIERKKQQAEFIIAKESHLQAQKRVEQHKNEMAINQKVQNARIENRRVRVKDLRDSIAKLTIKSPKDGMVIYYDWNDAKPAVGDTVYMGATLMTLPSLDNISVKVEFDESHTAKVNLGQEVKVTLDAFPERPFKGKISEIGKAYRNKSQRNLKVVFDAWVTLDTLDNDVMRPGMKATVELPEEEA